MDKIVKLVKYLRNLSTPELIRYFNSEKHSSMALYIAGGRCVLASRNGHEFVTGTDNEVRKYIMKVFVPNVADLNMALLAK